MDEHRLHLVERFIHRHAPCNRPAHRRAGAGPADKVDRNLGLLQGLDHAQMGTAQSTASGQNNADSPAGQETGDLGEIRIMVERDMMVQFGRARIDPLAAVADRLAGS